MKLKAWGVLLSCVWATAYSQNGPKPDSSAENAASGWAAYEAGRLDEAKALMSRAVAQNPNQADYQAALGVIESASNDPLQAVRHLKIAIRLKPGDAEYRLRLASLYQVSGHDLEALSTLQLANIDPNLGSSWDFTRAFSLFRLGRLREAGSTFESLLANPQFSAPANFFLGNIAFSENRFEDALPYYEAAMKNGDTETNIAYNAYAYNYGLALFRLNRYQEAEEQFRISVARFNRDPLPWMYLGRCEQELGNYQSAIAMLEKSIEIDPQFGLAYYELARLQKKFGDPARASQLFDKIAGMKQKEIAAEEKRARRLKVGAIQR